MRGEILHYDESQGFGFISGADGNRYTFRREDLRREMVLGKGTPVEFDADGGQAKNVFGVRAQAGSVPSVAGSSPLQDFPQANQQANPQAVTRPVQYGRSAAAYATADTGLWGYFTAALTTNYANFSTRARRKEYWGFVLFWYLVTIALMIALLAVDGAIGNMGDDGFPFATLIVLGLWMLGSIIPHIAITVRRQHDIGLSGWFYLLMLIPSVGGLIILVFTLIPTQMHENKWGPIPAGITPPPTFVPTS